MQGATPGDAVLQMHVERHRTARAIGTWGGVRPTLYDWGKNEDQLSREHQVVDHSEHGADGLYSMIGGKLASYRLFAEEMTDVIAKRLGNTAPRRSHIAPLQSSRQRAGWWTRACGWSPTIRNKSSA